MQAVEAGMRLRWVMTTAVVLVAVAVLVVRQRAATVPDAALLLPTTEQAVPADSAPGQQSSLAVDIVGAVQHPGLYYFAEGARVADAVDAAGGLAPDADRDALNLAVRLEDEEQIRVPRVGERDVPAQQVSIPVPESSGKALLDLNTADASALETLPDIGPAMAQRIVEYRTAHGPFQTVEQLQDVDGIGSATIGALRDLVVVNP